MTAATKHKGSLICVDDEELSICGHWVLIDNLTHNDNEVTCRRCQRITKQHEAVEKLNPPTTP